MKKSELFKLRRGFQKIEDLTGKDFVVPMAKNQNLIEAEVAAMERVIKPTKEINEYQKERTEMVKTHAAKDKDGKFVIDHSNPAEPQYVIDPTKQADFDKKLATLQKKHKDAVKLMEKQQQEFVEMMDEDVPKEFLDSLIKVSYENVPDNASQGQLAAISSLLTD